MLKYVILVGLLMGTLLITAKPRPDKPYLHLSRPLNFAHRGGALLAPENTLTAFRNAVEIGADVLELDIHATKDSKLVVIHDSTVEGPSGTKRAVKELALEELKRLKPTIPALREVFAEFPDRRINIEIKPANPPIAAKLASLIKEMRMTDKVLVASYDYKTIKNFRRLAPKVATGASAQELRVFHVFRTLGLIRFYNPRADAFQVPEYYRGIHVVTEAFIKAAHSKNIKVHVWTVNDEEAMRRLLQMGVDGIMTDRPDLLKEVLSTLTWE